MNHVFLEERSKEKISDLIDEGLISQAASKSRKRKLNLLNWLGKRIAVLFRIKVHRSFSKERHSLRYREEVK